MASGGPHMSRLRWHCRRGMLELDLLLGRFLEREYIHLDERQREAFESLLNLPDQLLYERLMDDTAGHDREFDDVIKRIRNTAAS